LPEQPIETYSPSAQLPQLQFSQPKIVPSSPFETTETAERALQPVEDSLEYPTANVQAQPTTPTLKPVDLTRSEALQNNATQSTTQTSQPTPRNNNSVIRFITQYTHTFILGGLTVASVVIVGSIAIISLISQFGTTATTETSHQYFNSSALHFVAINPLSTLTITQQISRHNNAVGVSEIIIKDNEGKVIPTTILTQLLKLPIDPSFNASLLDIRFGWYREEPFIVLRYSGDTIARGALLQWEQTMYADLLPLFSQTPVSSTQLTQFKDIVINEIDVRALYTTSNGEEFLYGIVAPGHLIITTSEIAFLNLSNNFNVR